jgi:O-acetyl-ADP-ribose deacetylase (regulator of RNase III)
MRIEAAQSDITREHVDAIVNAANTSLARGAGVCGAIFAAAGPELDAACEVLRKEAELRSAKPSMSGSETDPQICPCPTGDAKLTPGFRLPARFVVHAVGPFWHGGDHGEAESLASAYRRSLEVAAEAGARSIAFPAISTGIYGFPKRAAAEIAVGTLRGASTPIEVARLVAFDAETYDLYQARLG